MAETKVVFIVIDPTVDDREANGIIKVQVLPSGIAMVDALNEILKGYEVDMFLYNPESMPHEGALTYDMREARSIN
jgi:hypothetical protein